MDNRLRIKAVFIACIGQLAEMGDDPAVYDASLEILQGTNEVQEPGEPTKRHEPNGTKTLIIRINGGAVDGGAA